RCSNSGAAPRLHRGLPQPSSLPSLPEAGSLLFLRHSGLAQAGKKGAFIEGGDARGRRTEKRLYSGNARIKTVGVQPLSFGKRLGGELALAFDRVGRGEIGGHERSSRGGVAGLLQPEDCVIDARLQQMHEPDLGVPDVYPRISWADPD